MRQRLLGALACACAMSAAATLDAAESWTEVRSPSFVVATDGSEKDARRVALQFERMRAFLGQQWPWARLDPQRPVTILAVRDEDGMRALARCSIRTTRSATPSRRPSTRSAARRVTTRWPGT